MSTAGGLYGLLIKINRAALILSGFLPDQCANYA
jgi:hypothetical protein